MEIPRVRKVPWEKWRVFVVFVFFSFFFGRFEREKGLKRVAEGKVCVETFFVQKGK